MTSNYRKKASKQFNFGKLKGKEIIANFSGGSITSNAGIILIAELDKRLKISKQFADCFQDYRNSSYIDYSVEQLVTQRIYGLVLGYEDVNDHDKLRHDAALAIALEKLDKLKSNPGSLAGKSTINRLEYCPETILNQENSRYHRIEHHPKQIEKLFIDIFLQSYKKPPSQIILDMDVTDDRVHGNQEGAFFNTYYQGVCYAPLYIFSGHHLLVAKLRSSNVDPADGALEELQRVIGLIRKEWPNTQILVRGDSAYAREEIFNFCEKQDGVEYAIAMATNSQLKLRANQTIEKAKNEYSKKLEPIVELMESLFEKNEDLEVVRTLVPSSNWYCSLCYQTEKSWSRLRRVVTKVCYGSEGLNIRHVVTSLPAAKISPSALYTDKYCPRGEMENRLKEQQLDLFADRTSTQTFQSNQLRLWFSSIAYVLMQAFRHHCLSKTSFSQATVGTIRLNFLKLGARITVSFRRILIAITSACPSQDILSIAYFRIQGIQDTG
jgi:Transposase DDE domain group 1